MMTLFDDEQIMKTYVDCEVHDAYRKTAERLLRAGKLTPEEIACYMPEISAEEVKEIEDEILQTV